MTTDTVQFRCERAGADKVQVLFHALDRDCKAWCVLAGYDCLPDRPVSDIDFMVSNEDLARMPRIMTSVARESGLALVLATQHESTACRYDLASLEGAKITFIQADAAGDYRRDGRLLIRSAGILSRRRQHPLGFWIPSAADAFLYYLVKRIHKRSFTPDHGAYLSPLYREDPAGCRAAVRKFWATQPAQTIADAAETSSWDEIISRTDDFARQMKFPGSPVEKVKSAIMEIQRSVQRLTQPTGLLLTLLGPDGAGKSTAIEAVLSKWAEEFPKTAPYHLRPGILRGTEAGRQFTATPHSKPARGTIASMMKLLYFSADYCLGYWIHVRPRLVRSTLVVFDRYFYDLDVDAKRFRLRAPDWMIRAIGPVIPSPDLVLILDAPGARIHARKQELGVEEIERQRARYRELARRLGPEKARVIDASQPIEQVTADCFREILEYMESRTRLRLHQ